MALKLNNRPLYPFALLLFCGAAIAGWYYFAPEKKGELLVSTVGAIAGLGYFLYRQHLDETKLFKELFVEFNGRYNTLNGKLNAIRFGPREGLLAPEEREHIFDYFNLCAEEYFFYKTGYIDERVWNAWYRGMRDFFEHPRIRALWEQDCESKSYYGFEPPQ